MRQGTRPGLIYCGRTKDPRDDGNTMRHKALTPVAALSKPAAAAASSRAVAGEGPRCAAKDPGVGAIVLQAASHRGSGRGVATPKRICSKVWCGEEASGQKTQLYVSSGVTAEDNSTGVIPRTAHQTSARWAAAARLPRHQLAVHEVGHKSFPCLVSAPTTAARAR